MNPSIALQKNSHDKILEQIITKGDLSSLTPEQKVSHYNAVCQSLGLNPLTRPFEYITLNNQLQLYARKDCTEQLRRINQVSIWKVDQKTENDCWVVAAYAKTPDGREDVDLGIVSIKGKVGDTLANAQMKAITKAKRRVTLSICGLGFLDESEIETIPNARPVEQLEQDAVMTESEAEQLTLSYKASGLDQWKCRRASAMQLIKVCAALKAKGVDDELMRSRLPGGVQSRKDLTEEQAQEAIKAFNHWLNTYNEVVEGGVVNG